jgi:hypothetical protein
MKVELALDYGIEKLLTDFAAAAKTTPDVLVSRIVNGRFQEMGELLDFANAYSEGSDNHEKVFALLANYDGGEYVFRAMKEIDPEYQTPEESLMSIDDAFLDDLSASLDKHLKASPK